MASKLYIWKDWRQCTKCLTLKSWDNFYKEKWKRFWHSTICSECFIQLKKESDARISRIKENRIDWQRFKKHEVVVERMTTPHPVVVETPQNWEGEIIRIWENPVPFLSLYIK